MIRKLNSSKKLKTVFGSNCFFFYEILVDIDDSVQKIDLTHAFSKPDYGIELSSLPFVKYLHRRVVINEKTFKDFEELYTNNNLMQFYNRIIKIENGISILKTPIMQKDPAVFNVGFVGRWSKEKRPELFIEIAKAVKSNFSEIQFFMAGSGMDSYQKIIEDAGITYKGEIFDEVVLNEFYESLHLILITSYREGFPVVIMEAMAKGVVPIVTEVGGLNEHIKEKNGILIDNSQTEEKLIEDFVYKILDLNMNREKLEMFSHNAASYAQKEFNIEKFNKQYQQLLLVI
ncbi:glycosyltransferase family 4 protein [Flavobacterium sharifuzzamanii]|uniref:glycosyltransferase family 4 protein n=1 Tax=Flavobacterium sharifuzzamanii TaxID=2211133 RepID=UPI00193C8ED0|nr:glycosyltransferase family 4 protein [Flavobacterium sharifuzzamanii]